MKNLIAIGLLVLAASASAQTVLTEGSEIRFVSRQLGVPVEGRFTKWQAELRFDPRQAEAGQVRLSIDTGSARLGNAEADSEVRKPEWFDVARFPQARFESTAFKAAGPGRYEVSGALTIKGQTQNLVVPVTLEGRTASGSFTIKRLAFAIGDGEWADTSLVANDVQVRFKFQLDGLRP